DSQSPEDDLFPEGQCAAGSFRNRSIFLPEWEFPHQKDENARWYLLPGWLHRGLYHYGSQLKWSRCFLRKNQDPTVDTDPKDEDFPDDCCQSPAVRWNIR